MWYKESKKKDSVSPIEQELKDLKSPKPEPKVVNEKQLEDYRSSIPTQTTEQQLNSSRKDSKKNSGLIEGRLDDSKDGVVKHRNEEAHKGDINKLEELRLSGKNIQEEEKRESASETPKDQRFTKEKGDDGLRLAQVFDGSAQKEQDPSEDFLVPEDFPTDAPTMEEEEPEAEAGDEDSPTLVEKTSPKITDQGGTKIQTGVISFLLNEFTDQNGNLDGDSVQQEVKRFLASRYSIATPSLGKIKLLVSEQRGEIAYMSPVQ